MRQLLVSNEQRTLTATQSETCEARVLYPQMQMPPQLMHETILVARHNHSMNHFGTIW